MTSVDYIYYWQSNENRNNVLENKLNSLMCYVYKLDDNDEKISFLEHQ